MTLIGKDDLAQFQIAHDQSNAMAHLNGANDLREELSRVRLGQTVLVGDVRMKIARVVRVENDGGVVESENVVEEM